MPLYLVATPIGNLEDITLRALRNLKEVQLIAAEDTRRTRKLLSLYHIHTPLTSYHQYNKKAKLNYLLNLLEEEDIALVSEAGMPGISDPGYELVVGCIETGIPVIPIPGPSAIISALAASGLPTTDFLYLGFLPRKKGERWRLLQAIAQHPYTLVALETPHRLRESLSDLQEILGDRRIAVCHELTKFHEEIFRGSINQALEHFPKPKGEFTLIIEGKEKERRGLTEEIKKELRRLKMQGLGAKEAISQLSRATGIPKRELYQAWLTLKEM